jgi:DNA transformation protein and related proteins
MKSQRERKKRSPGSLAVSTSYRRFVLDQFEELGEVTPRDMFGGVGLYWRDVFFGIIARDVLYFKVDDSSRREYVRRGMRPFQPYPNRTGTMQYYEVPLSVIESPTELARWARKAIQLGS